MFGISSTELLVVIVFGFLLFGPDKLPQMGRTIGRALRQFRETQEKMTRVVQSEVIDPLSAPTRPAPAAPAVDDDADVEEDAEPARPKETFAERRARLAAEKAAQEAGTSEGDGPDAASDEPAPVQAAESAPASDASAAPEQDEEPVVSTTEDLYARRPRKRARAVESVTAEQPVEDVEGGEQ